MTGRHDELPLFAVVHLRAGHVGHIVSEHRDRLNAIAAAQALAAVGVPVWIEFITREVPVT